MTASARWTVVSNGGPNGKMVGKTVPSIDQALAISKTMLKSLGASRLVISSGNEFQQVLTEEEAADGEEVT